MPRPSSTVLLRVSSTSTRDAGIGHHDLAEGFTLKRPEQQAGRLVLQPANPAFPVLTLAPGEEPQLWGMALHVIRRLA